jgi:hypothetical protein
MARGISLHIGLNTVDPDHYDGWDGTLTACEYDANDMQALAESRGFETNKQLTNKASADAVTTAIKSAADDLESGDILFISYSGHGGQVPDRNGDEKDDHSDETWVLYDRQLVDDELYALWATFKPGVRIIVLSDSCHSGSVARGIDDKKVVPNVVATAEEAAKQSPRFRALPLDKMIATYEKNAELYDGIQKAIANSSESEPQIGATVLLISGCQDSQLSRDGFSNGLFTEQLLSVWDKGAWKGSYPNFHQAIVTNMPDDQKPNYYPVPPGDPNFEQQDPFTIG